MRLFFCVAWVSCLVTMGSSQTISGFSRNLNHACARPILDQPVHQTAAVSAAPSSASQTDTEELRQDIARMKALVQQMEQNLGFVDTTQSPLKHQFQLEIDMWKTMIGEMERKLNSSRHPRESR